MSNKIKITAFCLAAVLAFGSTPLYVSGAAAGANETEQSLDEMINYSDGKDSYKELSVADLLRASTGISITSAEKEYFSICEIKFKYNDSVPATSVSYTKTDDGFVITASPYSYEASNGATVGFIPLSVTVNGVTKTFTDDVYEAEFTGLTDGETYEISTKYVTEITVPKPVLTELANAGYDEGQRVIEQRKAYGEALAVYESEWEIYGEEYAEYSVKNEEYLAYLDELSRYNAEKAEYDAYIEAKEKYEKDYAAWSTYAEDYEKYAAALADYEEKNALYEEQYGLYPDAYAALDECRKSMEVLESIFIRDSAGHTMYGTLMGDTVTTVVARRNELVDYGVNKDDLDNAGQSTERLVAVLAPYNKLKTERERFEYYKENYGEIKSQFMRLYQALHSLANTALVRMELSKKEKLERYYQFVAQLYVISAGLDDSLTFSDEWNVRGNTAADVLDEAQIAVDRDLSDPSEHNYPEMDLQEKPVRPVEPVKIDEPHFDYETEPQEPSDPPAAVDEPVEPEKPASERPDAPVFTAQQLAIENEILNGTLKQRRFGSSHPLTFKTEVTRTALFSASYVLVSFYDYDGKTLLQSENVISGGDVSYNGITPARDADVKNTYVFSGWVDENGEPASFNNINGDKSFYASYDAVPVKYTVTFELHKEKVSAEFSYGDRPVCPAEVSSYFEFGVEYVFDGWSPALEPVTCDTTYKAEYIRTGPEPEFIPGDANGDKAVNNKDVVAIFKAVSDVNFVYGKAFDFDENGAVNNKDVVALFKYVSYIYAAS